MGTLELLVGELLVEEDVEEADEIVAFCQNAVGKVM